MLASLFCVVITFTVFGTCFDMTLGFSFTGGVTGKVAKLKLLCSLNRNQKTSIINKENRAAMPTFNHIPPLNTADLFLNFAWSKAIICPLLASIMLVFLSKIVLFCPISIAACSKPNMTTLIFFCVFLAVSTS